MALNKGLLWLITWIALSAAQPPGNNQGRQLNIVCRTYFGRCYDMSHPLLFEEKNFDEIVR